MIACKVQCFIPYCWSFTFSTLLCMIPSSSSRILDSKDLSYKSMIKNDWNFGKNNYYPIVVKNIRWQLLSHVWKWRLEWTKSRFSGKSSHSLSNIRELGCFKISIIFWKWRTGCVARNWRKAVSFFGRILKRSHPRSWRSAALCPFSPPFPSHLFEVREEDRIASLTQVFSLREKKTFCLCFFLL